MKTQTVVIEKKNKEGKIVAKIDYAKVTARLAEFHKLHPSATIKTDVEFINNFAMFRVTLIPDCAKPERYFNGTSLGNTVTEKGLEKLETIAVGRALAFAGFLADGEIASYEEMKRYKEKQELSEEEIALTTKQLKSTKTREELQKVWRSIPQSHREDETILHLKNTLKESYETIQVGAADTGMGETTTGEGNGNGA